MILFPAIDILNGKAVRLYRGDKNQVTEYGDPIEFAEKWVEAGAEWLHVVDLAGAFSGETPSSRILSRSGSFAGSSRSRPSCERCQRFLSFE